MTKDLATNVSLDSTEHPGEWSRRWSAALMNNYGLPPLTLTRGLGARVWDDDDREYLDLLAGIAVNALGHAHPALVAAVTEQVATLGHTSNLAMTTPSIRLAEKLLELLDPTGMHDGRVLFSNSGAEANETAFKLSRLTGRQHVVVAENSFHGRTMGALALTAQPAKQDPFRPLPGDVMAVPFGDVDALRRAVTSQTAAVFIEPIQGEAGIIASPVGYLSAVREITSKCGALLVIDEVQTGIGRTGAWFAHQRHDVVPDVVTLAKGLGGGLPIGACVAFGDAGALLIPGTHGTTFGGNPVVCAAALAVLNTIEVDALLPNVQHLSQRLKDVAAQPIQVHHVRGEGFMLGVVLREPMAVQVEAAARDHGIIINAVRPDVLRLTPPLILSIADVDLFEQRWPTILTDAADVYAGAA